MAEGKRLLLETETGKDCYKLPKDCGAVLGVRWVSRRYEETLALFFEAPHSPPWLKVFALDRAPATPGEVRHLLKRAYTEIVTPFRYTPVWMRSKDNLLVYPAPYNDGDYLVLTVEGNEE